ncbi:hypothetical protein [Phytoactinopolyspora halotolerans]|uniref:DUF4352 domain-containing protein n=1 Tax=Phytoactinopolyspora halotolerans TaxID=1981512 RepID=A0A6L9SAS4_9ACTN|nr:hypothetical protein [Phytoactinopolyspora halotolerans]NEE01100.1 hypothetical protein [Phytoactinopolyspora halotolerans]
MRRTLSKRRMLVATAAAALALGLTACSSDDDGGEEAADTEPVAQSDEAEDDAGELGGDADDSAGEEEEEPAEDEPADDEPDDAAEGGGDTPEWAAAVTTPGEKLTTLEGANFEVEIYQVGVAPSPKDGLLVDPDSNQPVLAEGDDIVFVNYVITNTSDETIPMSSSLVSVSAEYEDWPYLQGMDSITDNDLYEEMDVNSDGVGARRDDGVYPLGPGQSIAYGDNFMYRTDAAVIFEATLTPVDETGDLVSDEQQEVTAEVTLS